MMFMMYGFGINYCFNFDVYFIEKKEVIEGVDWCKDCFDVMIKENDMVRVEESRKFLDYWFLRVS